MRTVLVVGIGAGDPSHLTAEAIAGLRRADVLFEVDRDTVDLTALRREICGAHLGAPPPTVRIDEPRRDRGAADYSAAVTVWREQRAEAWQCVIAGLDEHGVGAFLVWGDPSLYDSTLAVLDEIASRGEVAFQREVIPGISSVHALTARHGIALNRIGSAVQITTGRRLARFGLPAGVADVVVMLDGRCAFTTISEPGVEIYWGAYLGTPDELLISGPVGQVATKIVAERNAARTRKGWVMDCYLLRRSLDDDGEPPS